MSSCCTAGFQWDGKPVGKETKLANLDTYVSGENKDAAVLIVHDVFGWTLTNVRLLADHYASEAGVTVYVPDFFGGEIVTPDMMENPDETKRLDIGAFMGRHSKDIRGPEIFACAKALKQELGFKKVGAIGFCYGGWAVFRLGAKGKPSCETDRSRSTYKRSADELEGNNLVDCISMAHPSGLEKSEIDNVSVPVQICAPEIDPIFTPELKEHANKVIPELKVEYDYQYFPGLVHGFATRGEVNNPTQKNGLERAKNAAVYWFRQHLSS
ncbi:hypothetical protein H2200_005595 [Cladophialophora chaetospira]|uniref:Dienelactone hydrolase domain-containing protein n=1 Tax=Cladophialophora chaetospira TaxID=386627 RepID=A0AA38XCA7_9EURO|nr:hypothetical protein H2200_005595 [Cladophialophora chaetospira]